MNKITFSRKNAIFLGLCLGGLVLLVGIGILPLNSQHRRLDQKRDNISKKLAQQQQSQADIAAVDNILTQIDQQPTPQVVAISPLPQDKTSQITDDFRLVAREVSLTVDSINPLLDKKTDWKNLSVHAECYGELDNIRQLLIKLLYLPYVRQIEHLEIHPGTSTLRLSLTYTIDLA